MPCCTEYANLHLFLRKPYEMNSQTCETATTFGTKFFWSMLTLFNGCPGPCRGGFVFKNFEMGTLNGGRYI